MGQPIIVAIDAPDRGADALALGRMLASSPPAKLVLTHVVPPTPPGWGGVEFETDVQDEGRDLLAKFATDLDAARVERRVLDWPSAARAVTGLAEDVDARLIVLGSSHRAKDGHVRLGGAGSSIVTGAACAVAVAPRGYRDRAPEAPARIGVAYDATPEADRALEFAIALAGAASASLRLWFVVGPTGAHGRNPKLYADFTDYVHHWASTQLDAGRARVPDGISVSSEVREGDAAEEIAKAAAEEDIDVVIVGSRRFGPIRRVVLGSTSHRLLRHARGPVIVVPRPEHASPSS